MKKILLMAVAAIMLTTSVNAQRYEYPKHEIALSYGGAPLTDFLDIFESAVLVGLSVGTPSYYDEKCFGAISAEYYYRLGKIVGVGGILNYSNITRELNVSSKKYGESISHFFTLMPGAKFNWIDKKHFGLYSKAAIGVTVESKKDKLDSGGSESDSYLNFNFQASLLGVDFGSPAIRGFVELGFGQQGILIGGLRYRF